VKNRKRTVASIKSSEVSKPALAAVKADFGHWRDYLTPDGGKQHLRDVQNRGAVSYYSNIAHDPDAVGEWVRNLEREARNQGGSDLGRRAIAAEILKRGDRMPDVLRDYVIEILQSTDTDLAFPKHAIRNILICQEVARIASKYGLHPTRNRSRNRETFGVQSGCSIVAQALKDLGFEMIEESNVEKIWQERPRNLRKSVRKKQT
jgi:hypothetical protein